MSTEEPPFHISAQRQDVIHKLLVKVLHDAVPDWHDLHLPPITQELPANLPEVVVQQRYLDTLFVTADGALLDLEFQSTLDRADLIRFANYALQVAATYHQPVRVVVIYTGPVPHPPHCLDLWSLRFCCRLVVLAAVDGRDLWERIRARTRTGGPWTPDLLLDLAYLPFVHHPTWSRAGRARAALAVAATLPPIAGAQALAVVAGLTLPLLPPDVVKSLQEALRMNPILQEWTKEWAAEALAQARAEALAQGREQGLVLGREQGQAALLTAVLRRRFGTLAPAVVDAVTRRLTEPDGEAVAADLVLADSLAEVERLLEIKGH